MGGMQPDMVTRSIFPVIMTGVLGIYGLITSVILNGKIERPNEYGVLQGYAGFTSGMVAGLSAMAAGFAIGVVDDAGARANAQQPRLSAETAADRLWQKRLQKGRR